MKKQVLLSIGALFSLCASAGSDIKSTYTSTRANECIALEPESEEEEGGGSYRGECPGVGGYKLQLLDGDDRQTLNLVTPSKKVIELDFWSYYTGFSQVGETVEWRECKDAPIALIARYNVSDPKDEKKQNSYLMVVKIEKSKACVIDIVAPSAKQNEEARKLADVASKKACKKKP